MPHSLHLVHGDGAVDIQPLGRRPRAGELAPERRDVTRCVGGGQELLRARLSLRVCDPRGDRHGKGEGTGARRLDHSRSPGDRPLPGDVGFADDSRHYFLRFLRP